MIEIAKGGEGNDHITGNNADNILYGNNGNDILYGGFGNDIIYGGDGEDTVVGGAGNDIIHATLDGDNDTINGGIGFDTVDYSQETSFILADANASGSVIINDGSNSDSISGAEKFILTNQDDTFYFTGDNYFGNGISHIDGNGTTDNDTIIFESDVTVNLLNNNTEYWAGIQKVNLENIENVSASQGVKLILDENVTSTQINNAINYTSGYAATLDYSLSGVSYAFDETDTLNNIIGSDYGDSFNASLQTYLRRFYTGEGNDIVDVDARNDQDFFLDPGYLDSNISIGYKGGIDTYNISEFMTEGAYVSRSSSSVLIDNPNIILSDITETLTRSTSNPNFFNLFLDIDGHGSININWTGSNYAKEFSVGLVSGGYIKVSDYNVIKAGSTIGANIYEGSWGDDVLIDNSDYGTEIRSYGGDDRIFTGNGDDAIYAYEGTNYIDSGKGVDYIIGGLGNDTIIYDYTYDEMEPGVVGRIGGSKFISDTGGIDNIVLLNGNYSNFYFYQDNYDLVLQDSIDYYDPESENYDYLYSENVELIRIENHYADVRSQLEFVTYDNGQYDVINGIFTPFSEIIGTSNSDTLNGTSSTEIIRGLDDDDIIFGNDGSDYIYGGSGNDDIEGGLGNDEIYGGYKTYYQGDSGIDIARYSSNFQDYTITLIGSTAYGIQYVIKDNIGTDGIDNLYGIETLEFSDGTFDIATEIFTSSGPITMYGTSSAETLNGGSNIDHIYGYEGDDTLNGNDGDDFLYGGAGNDYLNGGDGIDTASYEDAASRVVVVLNSNYVTLDGDGGSDTLFSIENIIGSDYNDNIWGGTLNNIIYAGAGNDNLILREGDDYFYGEDGNDFFNLTNAIGLKYLFGGEGNDIYRMTTSSTAIVDGGNGNDRIRYDYNQITQGITVNAELGEVDKDADGIADDIFTNIKFISASNHDDILYGHSGNDDFRGHDGNDIMYGYEGNDTLNGYEGDDTLYGGAGNDRLIAGSGTNILNGGDGGDRLYGGSGEDHFIFENTSAFNNVDQVYYFDETDNDAIDIADLLSQYDPLSDVLSDFVNLTVDGSDTFLGVDSDGGADNFVNIIKFYNTAYWNPTGISDVDTLEINGNLITS